MLKTKATNALASAKRNLPKIIKSLPAMGGLTSIIAVKKEVNSLKDKFYKWADTIRTGFEPNTSMKLQMEQNYTAYLQNNSSYKSSKEYQDAFRNKTLRDDLEIAESQINALLFVLGEGLGGTGTQSSYIKSGATSRTSSIKSVSERKTTLDFENTQVMYQYDQDGKEKASYVYGEADSRISGDLTKEAVKYTEQKAGDYSYLYDGQGNVTNTVRNGSVAESYSYDPFGEMTAEGKEGTSKTPLEAQNDNGLSDNDVLWGYNGEEYIEEVGLQYLRQRHYSPETGNFTSQDTNEGDLTNPLSQNRYIYAENDPVNGNDPGGDKKKSKKSSTKKTSKKSSKSSSKSSKKTSKKTNKKTTSKKSPSKKKATSKKSSSKKSGSLWNKLKTKAKSKVNKTKKAIKKKISSVKDKAKALKKSVTCKVKKVIKSGKTLLNNTKKLVRSGMTKVSNAYNKLKSGAKSALGYMGKSIKNFFVPESAYASSSSSSSTKKSAPKQTDLYQQMLLTSQYYQYVQSGGTKSFYEFKNSGSIMNDIHFMLDMIGVVFDGADPANGALYLSEGDYKNAGISFVAAVPVVGSLGTIRRVSKNLTRVNETKTNIDIAKKTEKVTHRMTGKESLAAAKKLGYEKTNYRTKSNEPVYYNKKTKTYISQDVGSSNDMGSHNGGVWKMAKSPKALNQKETRMGTYDADLNRIGD